MGKFFGTDGIRGVANKDLTPELAMKVGKAAAYTTLKKFNLEKALFIIGKDTRISADMLEGALIAGITSQGCDVLLAGIVPTPAVAYLTRSLDIHCGVVISASHNPVPDNGIKFFNMQGYKFTDDEEAAIEKILIDGEPDDMKFPTGADIGRVMVLPDASQRYESYIESRGCACLDGLKVVLDCANGATSQIAPDVFSDLGATIIDINDHPTGLNINVDCGSTHPETLQRLMAGGGFDVGLAFDGDGDRLIAVDETGSVVTGDELMNIYALYYKEKGELSSDTLVATVMSNMGLELSLKDKGITLLRSGVGDRLVLEEMLKSGAVIGGEQSGHIIFLKDNTTGDGILSAMHLLVIMKETGKRLSELRGWMKMYPQVMKNVTVKDKQSVIDNEDFRKYLAMREKEVSDQYRLLVRPSGTEPKIRVMAEGPDEESTAKLVDDVVREIERIGEKAAV